ncbi:uncharacterized protein LOC117649886 [Thrips palmi]|uniref:Uncharacterized protein LOC117649886 n=1 Tax=Thrips palmi TaxID=161013 RepID=A0A6P8ZVJ5_THRPL|nr:uncharacterized protein LOC117649886 [Thrips palmi]
MSSQTMEGAYVLCGCFIKDLEKFTVYGVLKMYEGGDIVKVRRTPDCPFELVAVLGSGVTKEEARAKANEYLTRIGRIDGVEDTTDLEYAETQEMDCEYTFYIIQSGTCKYTVWSDLTCLFFSQDTTNSQHEETWPIV